ncbi:hypothetical protein [Bacillus sp. AFS017336]|uniref:hypothetical protein n=1 Tax=Bacillus sp. AFS017336 TaxID=2033489 RepID=UPI000BEF80D7|nr:hypothetical protein [Bacillus sp. AFS017336]PEL13715.1 hypothetical protein CN601_03105 [Bacillus sp. AFS017336]
MFGLLGIILYRSPIVIELQNSSLVYIDMRIIAVIVGSILLGRIEIMTIVAVILGGFYLFKLRGNIFDESNTIRFMVLSIFAILLSFTNWERNKKQRFFNRIIIIFIPIFYYFFDKYTLKPRGSLTNQGEVFLLLSVSYIIVYFACIYCCKYAVRLAEQRVMYTYELPDKNIQLERIVNLDGLTKMFNRRFFDEQIEYHWNYCQKHQQPI